MYNGQMNEKYEKKAEHLPPRTASSGKVAMMASIVRPDMMMGRSAAAKK